MNEEANKLQPLESDIAYLEQQLQEKRDQLTSQQNTGQVLELSHEKEALHEIIGEKIAEAQSAQQAPGDNTNPASITPAIPAVNPPSYLDPALQEQVQILVNLAFSSGLAGAIQQARNSGNAALIDAFHDVLVDELYEYLLNANKLKRI